MGLKYLMPSFTYLRFDLFYTFSAFCHYQTVHLLIRNGQWDMPVCQSNFYSSGYGSSVGYAACSPGTCIQTLFFFRMDRSKHSSLLLYIMNIVYFGVLLKYTDIKNVSHPEKCILLFGKDS